MDREVIADPVYLGLTRPATVVGLPFNYVLFSITLAMLALMTFKTPVALIVFGPLYGFGHGVCHYDIRQFSIIGRWIILRLRCPNGWMSRGNIYTEWGSDK